MAPAPYALAGAGMVETAHEHDSLIVWEALPDGRVPIGVTRKSVPVSGCTLGAVVFTPGRGQCSTAAGEILQE